MKKKKKAFKQLIFKVQLCSCPPNSCPPIDSLGAAGGAGLRSRDEGSGRRGEPSRHELELTLIDPPLVQTRAAAAEKAAEKAAAAKVSIALGCTQRLSK